MITLNQWFHLFSASVFLGIGIMLKRRRFVETTVVIADTTQGLKESLDEIFAPFGGMGQALGSPDGTVYVKPNGVHFSPHTYTDPRVLEAVLATLSDHGYTRLAVMESCTGGNFTRLVYKVTGYDRICRRYGAEAVYLDEGPTVEVDLRDGTRARISRRLYDEIVNRNGDIYLNLPKLKTHSMATVTLGVKNQQAFPVDGDRMRQHSHGTLHRRLAALYALTRPDFCIIEGLTATAHGHFPATALLDECLVEMNVLIGGQDTLAVDVVGARVLGYGLGEVEHLRLCAEWGLGEGDLGGCRTRCWAAFTRRCGGWWAARRRASRAAGGTRRRSRRCCITTIRVEGAGRSCAAPASGRATWTICLATSWSWGRARARRWVTCSRNAIPTGVCTGWRSTTT
jgi:uncharacterized protein (DUF362 family)